LRAIKFASLAQIKKMWWSKKSFFENTLFQSICSEMLEFPLKKGASSQCGLNESCESAFHRCTDPKFASKKFASKKKNTSSWLDNPSQIGRSPFLKFFVCSNSGTTTVGCACVEFPYHGNHCHRSKARREPRLCCSEISCDISREFLRICSGCSESRETLEPDRDCRGAGTPSLQAPAGSPW
jgi:hypothetical protein